MLSKLPTDLRGLRDRDILHIVFAGALPRFGIVGLACGPEQTRDGGGWITMLSASTTSPSGLVLTIRGKTG